MLELDPNKVATVGRAKTNRIVILDERCSRFHCEVLRDESGWLLRDLDSSNGVSIRGERIVGTHRLSDGDVVRIGSHGLAFTYEISEHCSGSFDDQQLLDADTATTYSTSEMQIIERRQRPLFESDSVDDREPTSNQLVLAELYRLALAMGSAEDVKTLSEVVLEGILSRTSADIGAILLFPIPRHSDSESEQLRLIAYRSNRQKHYQLVSQQLSNVVLSGREAVLATDISTGSIISDPESLELLDAKSVICAPIRAKDVLCGLIHVYSTSVDTILDGDHLDFTLAVSDQYAVALRNLQDREKILHELQSAQAINESLCHRLQVESDLVGDSAAVEDLERKIAQVAPTNAIVLVRGESGVGKELVARAIHFNSRRSDGPLICMNCAALTETLLQSELFGHEKGAFTGATDRKIGKFEQAHQGTLFLDEIGEMSLDVQAKILRVLEGHPFERVGGRTAIEVDVRVVAATNKDLEQAIEENRFRRDLYFRLNVFEIMVQPLREHISDVPTLAQHFLKRFAREIGRAVNGFKPAAMDALMSYHWPGNVRELQNVIERSVILCSQQLVDVVDIQLSNLPTVGSADGGRREKEESREATLDDVERDHIVATLKRTSWNKSQASRILGIERTTLDRKIKRYDLNND